MIVRIIDVYVKAENVEEFERASLENRQGSIQEPGVLRFDVLQDNSDPGHFLLYEAYRDAGASEAHKQTAHYQEWKAAVEPMMARPRRGTACRPVAPADPAEW